MDRDTSTSDVPSRPMRYRALLPRRINPESGASKRSTEAPVHQTFETQIQSPATRKVISPVATLATPMDEIVCRLYTNASDRPSGDHAGFPWYASPEISVRGCHSASDITAMSAL